MSWCQGAKEPMSQGGLIMYLNENVFSVLVSLFAFSTCFLYLNENVLIVDQSENHIWTNQRIMCGPNKVFRIKIIKFIYLSIYFQIR